MEGGGSLNQKRDKSTNICLEYEVNIYFLIFISQFFANFKGPKEKHKQYFGRCTGTFEGQYTVYNQPNRFQIKNKNKTCTRHI